MCRWLLLHRPAAQQVFHIQHMAVCAELITYLPKAKSKQGINLLSGQDSSGNQSTHAEQAELAAVPREYISYLKPNLTIAMVDDFTKYPKNGIPPPVSIVILATFCCIAVVCTLHQTLQVAYPVSELQPVVSQHDASYAPFRCFSAAGAVDEAASSGFLLHLLLTSEER